MALACGYRVGFAVVRPRTPRVRRPGPTRGPEAYGDVRAFKVYFQRPGGPSGTPSCGRRRPDASRRTFFARRAGPMVGIFYILSIIGCRRPCWRPPGTLCYLHLLVITIFLHNRALQFAKINQKLKGLQPLAYSPLFFPSKYEGKNQTRLLFRFKI